MEKIKNNDGLIIGALIIGLVILLTINSGIKYEGSYIVGVSNDTQITNIDIDRTILNSGDMYIAEIQMNITANNTRTFKIISTTPIHMLERTIIASVPSSNILDYEIVIYEGGTDSSSGDLIDIFNLNRNSTNNNNQTIIARTITGLNLTSATILPIGVRFSDDKRYFNNILDTNYIFNQNTPYYVEINNQGNTTLNIDLSLVFFNVN